MIQAPQMQYIPQQPVPVGHQEIGAYPPVQQQSMPMQGAIYNYPTASSYLPAQNQNKQKYNGVNIEIVDPVGKGAHSSNCQQVNYMPPQPYMMNSYQPQNYMQPQQNSQGQYNGVNIEIINPQAQAGGCVPMQNVMPAQFYPPQYPQQYAQQMLNQPPIIQQMPQPSQVTQTPQIEPQANIQPQQPLTNETTVANAATEPVVPAPQLQQPQVAEQAIQPTQQTQVQEQSPVAQPVIEQPAQPSANINPESFAGRLATDDLDAQKATIEEIADKVKNSEQDGPLLLDDKIFDALTGIINKDTSNLQGPTPETLELRQKNPEELSPMELEKAGPAPMEKAAINKQIALYTMAYMYERLNNELESKRGSIASLSELPHIDDVVNVVKSNDENPMLKIGAIAVLSHINKPEYSQDFASVFELAQQDEDERVRDAATKAYNEVTGGNSSVTEENQAA